MGNSGYLLLEKSGLNGGIKVFCSTKILWNSKETTTIDCYYLF